MYGNPRFGPRPEPPSLTSSIKKPSRFAYPPETVDLELPEDNERLANLCGQLDQHLRQIERRLGIEINNRGHVFRLIGERRSVAAGEQVLRDLYAATAG